MSTGHRETPSVQRFTAIPERISLANRNQSQPALGSDADVESDTHKHFSTEEFATSVYGAGDGAPMAASTLKGFCEQRRAYLLGHPDIRGLD